MKTRLPKALAKLRSMEPREWERNDMFVRPGFGWYLVPLEMREGKKEGRFYYTLRSKIWRPEVPRIFPMREGRKEDFNACYGPKSEHRRFLDFLSMTNFKSTITRPSSSLMFGRSRILVPKLYWNTCSMNSRCWSACIQAHHWITSTAYIVNSFSLSFSSRYISLMECFPYTLASAFFFFLAQCKDSTLQ